MNRTAKNAFSAACAVVCVALVGLWERSYATADFMTDSRHFSLGSLGGRFVLVQNKQPSTFEWSDLEFGHIPRTKHVADTLQILDTQSVLGFGRFSRGAETLSWAPHWAFVLLFGLFAVAPWINWSKRFSLRTLLIVTTLVAVVLGVAVAFR